MARERKKQCGFFEREEDFGIWWIRYADQFGKIHIEMVGMFTPAVNLYQKRKTGIRQGRFDPEMIRPKNSSFAEIVVDRRQVAETTLRDLRREEQRLIY